MHRLKDDSLYAHWTFAVAKAHSQLAYMDHLLQGVSRQMTAAKVALDQSRALLAAYHAFEDGPASHKILTPGEVFGQPDGVAGS